MHSYGRDVHMYTRIFEESLVLLHSGQISTQSQLSGARTFRAPNRKAALLENVPGILSCDEGKAKDEVLLGLASRTGGDRRSGGSTQ